MRESEDKIHVFTLGNNQRHRRNVAAATRVLEKIIQLTGNSNVEHHIRYAETQSPETLWPSLSHYLDDGKVSVIYTGVTSNPPERVTDTFGMDTTQHDRTPENKTLLHDDGYYTPWTNVDKRKIAEMYQHAGLMQDLFPLTRSCEYNPDYDRKALFHKTKGYASGVKDPGMGHCGVCWWCEERLWAFGRLK